MATDATLLSVGVESSGVVEGTKNLEGLSASAEKAEASVAGLSKTAQASGDAFLGLSDAQRKVVEDNDRWVESQAQAAAMLGKTKEEALAMEGAFRGLNAAQMESLNQVIKYREEFNKLKETQQEANEGFKIGATQVALFGVAFGSVSEIARRFTDAMLSVIKSAIAGFAQWQDALVRFQAMLDITSNRAGKTTEGIAAMANAMSRSTIFDETAIVRASTTMLRFGAITGTTFDKAITLSADLATVLGTDVTSAAELVGRALENSFGTMMLRRMGLLTDSQVEYLRVLKQFAGDQAYVNELMAMLDKTVGGAAEKIGAHGLANAWKQFGNEVETTVRTGGESLALFINLEGIIRKMTEGIASISGMKFEDVINRWGDSMKANLPTAFAWTAEMTKWLMLHDRMFMAMGRAMTPGAGGPVGSAQNQDQNDRRIANQQAEDLRRETAALQEKTEKMKGVEKITTELADINLKAMSVDQQRAYWTDQWNQRMGVSNDAFQKEIAAAGGADAAMRKWVDSKIVAVSSSNDLANSIAEYNKMALDAEMTMADLSNTTETKMSPAMKKLIEQMGTDTWAKWSQAEKDANENAALTADAIWHEADAMEASKKSFDAYIGGIGKLSGEFDKSAAGAERQAAALIAGNAATEGASVAALRLATSTDEAIAQLLRMDPAQRAVAQASLDAAMAHARAADASMAYGATIKKMADETNHQYDSMEKQAASLEAQAATYGKSTASMAAYSVAAAQAAIANAALAAAQARANEAALAGNEDVETVLAAQRASAVATLDLADKQKLLIAQLDLSKGIVDKETAAYKDHAATVGMTKEQLDAYRISQIDTNIATLQGAELLLDKANPAYEEQKKKLEDLIVAFKGLREAAGQAAAADTADEFNKAWGRAFEDVSRSAGDFLVSFREHGSSAFKDLWNDFVNWALRAIATVMAQKIILSITAGTSLGGAAQQAFGGPNSASSLFDLFTGSKGSGGGGGFGGFGSSLYNSFAWSGAGQALGLSTAGLAMGPPTAAGLMSVPMELTTLGSTIGSFIPYVGPIVAAVSLLSGLFKSDPSQVKGQFGVRPTGTTTGWEDNAYTTSKLGNLGFLDAQTQYFSGAAAQAFNKMVATTLDEFSKRMTEAQKTTFSTALQGTQFPGMEGTYTTEDFLSKYGSKILGQVTKAAFDVLDPAMSSVIDKFSGTSDEMAKFVDSLLLVYDATKDLTEADHKRVDAMLDGSQAAADAAVAFAQGYATLEEISKADPFADAAKAISAASNTAMSTFYDQASALRDLIDSFDGSVAQTQALTAATQAYYVAEVQLLAQIQQVKKAIGDMFGNTIRSMTLQTLSPKQQYDYLQNEASQAYKQMQGETDPAKIQALASKINDDLNAAFGLLSPEQQHAMLQGFIDRANDVNQYVQDHLTDIGTDVATAATDVFADVHAKLDEFADKLAAVSATMDSAGNKQIIAANTPVPVAVTVTVDNSSEIGG